MLSDSGSDVPRLPAHQEACPRAACLARARAVSAAAVISLLGFACGTVARDHDALEVPESAKMAPPASRTVVMATEMARFSYLMKLSIPVPLTPPVVTPTASLATDTTVIIDHPMTSLVGAARHLSMATVPAAGIKARDTGGVKA